DLRRAGRKERPLFRPPAALARQRAGLRRSGADAIEQAQLSFDRFGGGGHGVTGAHGGRATTGPVHLDERFAQRRPTPEPSASVEATSIEKHYPRMIASAMVALRPRGTP